MEYMSSKKYTYFKCIAGTTAKNFGGELKI